MWLSDVSKIYHDVTGVSSVKCVGFVFTHNEKEDQTLTGADREVLSAYAELWRCGSAATPGIHAKRAERALRWFFVLDGLPLGCETYEIPQENIYV